jgi:hypothetical protein
MYGWDSNEWCETCKNSEQGVKIISNTEGIRQAVASYMAKIEVGTWGLRR